MDLILYDNIKENHFSWRTKQNRGSKTYTKQRHGTHHFKIIFMLKTTLSRPNVTEIK